MNWKGISKYLNPTAVAAVFFVFFFVVSVFCVDDYGIVVDEETQRMHSLVAYKYINQKLFDREIPELESIPDLAEYNHPYYGTFIQMPMVAIEDIKGFSMSARDIFRLRHRIIFFIVFSGYICLYLALRRIIGNESWIPLVTVMLMALYPRFFGFMFFDIKNMVFVGLSLLAISTIVFAVERGSTVDYILVGISSAIATNSRVMGVMYPVVLIGYFALSDLRAIVVNHKERDVQRIDDKPAISGFKKHWRFVARYAFVVISFALTWYAITPYAWKNPFAVFIGTFRKFSHYDTWHGTMVFMGKLITCEEMPWYYLPVWFGISIPIVYLVLFFVCNINLVVDVARSKDIVHTLLEDKKWVVFSFVLFYGSVLSVIVLHSRIYIGWHHMYFVFVPFCMAVGLGLKEFIDKKSGKIFAICLGTTLLVNTIWMGYYYPSVTSYLNSFGKFFGASFDREEHQASGFQCLQWIADHSDEPVTVGGGYRCYESLTDEQKEKIIPEQDNPKYIIDGYRNVIGNAPVYDGYVEEYTISVDGYKVCSVFKRIKDE